MYFGYIGTRRAVYIILFIEKALSTGSSDHLKIILKKSVLCIRIINLKKITQIVL